MREHWLRSSIIRVFVIIFIAVLGVLLYKAHNRLLIIRGHGNVYMESYAFTESDRKL